MFRRIAKWINRFRKKPTPAKAAPYKLEPVQIPKTELHTLAEQINQHQKHFVARPFVVTRNIARAQQIVANRRPGKRLPGQAGPIIGQALAELKAARDPLEVQYAKAAEFEKEAGIHANESRFQTADAEFARQVHAKAQTNTAELFRRLDEIKSIIRNLQE